MATYQLTLNEEEHELEVEERDDGFHVRLGDTWHPVELERVGDAARYSLLVDRRPYDVFAEESPHGFHIVIGSRLFAVTTPGLVRGRRAGGPAGVAAPTESGEWVLASPMAGVIQEVLVQPGDEVEAGQAVIVIEAMKMQNELRARRAGTVKAVYVSVGQRVEQGTPLLVLL
ncbi:MAG: biotin/lipoyl-containing protein [Dehalococcoidia bacterium]|nr:biotin/lipoyl-containing protein [Dehalococcoidia bacterium]